LTKYFVYILRTDKDTLYTGQTGDLEKRMEQHRMGKGARYLKMFTSFGLVYTEKVKTRSLALKREMEIKQMSKKEKEILIKLRNDNGKQI
jgi:putative endonuclease